MAKKIILTVDDSPSSKFEEMLDFLNSHQMKAIFFCIGQRMEDQKELLQHAILTGHILGNHSFSHPRFSDIPLKQCKEEILYTHDLIENLYSSLGFSDYPKVFRFPFGDKGDYKFGHHFLDFYQAYSYQKSSYLKIAFKIAKNILPQYFLKKENSGVAKKKQLQKYLNSLGYQAVNSPGVTYDFIANLRADYDWPWTMDAAEWKWYGTSITSEIRDDIVNTLFSKKPYLGYGEILEPYGMTVPDSDEILLLHDHPETLETFQVIIESLQGQGVEFHLPEQLL